MKCTNCGLESEFEDAFQNDPHSGIPPKKLCPVCWQKSQHSLLAWWLAAYTVCGLLGLTFLWLEPLSVFGQVLLCFFLFQLMLIVSIVPHEFGHAAAAWLLRWRVFSIIIGVGKTIYKREIRGVVYELKSIPAGGVVYMSATEPHRFRMKYFLTTLAGPLVNLVFVVATLAFLSWEEVQRLDFSALPLVGKLFLYANIFILVFNLWPRNIDSLPGRPASDGKRLLNAFFLKQKDIQENCAMRFVLEGMRHYEKAHFLSASRILEDGLHLYPRDFNLQLTYASNKICLKQYAKARELFLGLLRDEQKADLKRYILLNNIAYVNALILDPALWEEADAYSKESYEAIPWYPFVTGTRGSVLVRLGQTEEGLKLLRKSCEEAKEMSGKAQNACFIAIGEAKQGQFDEALASLRAAKQYEPNCFLLEQAEKEVKSLQLAAEPQHT